MCDLALSYLVVVVFASVFFGAGVIMWDYWFHRRTENQYTSIFPSVSPYFSVVFMLFAVLTFYLYTMAYVGCDLGVWNLMSVLTLLLNIGGVVVSCSVYEPIPLAANAGGILACNACCEACSVV